MRGSLLQCSYVSFVPGKDARRDPAQNARAVVVRSPLSGVKPPGSGRASASAHDHSGHAARTTGWYNRPSSPSISILWLADLGMSEMFLVYGIKDNETVLFKYSLNFS